MCARESRRTDGAKQANKAKWKRIVQFAWPPHDFPLEFVVGNSVYRLPPQTETKSRCEIHDTRFQKCNLSVDKPLGFRSLAPAPHGTATPTPHQPENPTHSVDLGQMASMVPLPPKVPPGLLKIPIQNCDFAFHLRDGNNRDPF